MSAGKMGAIYSGIVLTYLFGTNHEALLILLTLVVMDGVLTIAVATDTDTPMDVGPVRFAVRKLAYAMLIILANLVDRALGTDPPILATTAIWLLVTTEAAICVGHLATLGVPIPENVKGAIEIMQGRDKPVGHSAPNKPRPPAEDGRP